MVMAYQVIAAHRVPAVSSMRHDGPRWRAVKPSTTVRNHGGVGDCADYGEAHSPLASRQAKRRGSHWKVAHLKK